MVFSLNTQIAGYHIPIEVNYFFYIIWIIVGLIIYIYNLSKNYHYTFFFKKIALIFIEPKLLFLLYSYFLFIFGLSDKNLASTGLTQILSILIPLAYLYLFGLKIITYIYYSCLISFLILIWITIFNNGLISLTLPFRSMIDSYVVNPFETHEITFTVGFLFMYYACFYRLNNKIDIIKLVLCLIMLLFGFKRIQLIAIVVSVMFFMIINHLRRNASTFLINFSFIILLSISWMYLIFLYNGEFFTLIANLGFNTSGRLYYYNAITSITEFSPSFLGLGLNSVSKLLESDFSYLHVGGLHNDILKLYAELGFLMFCAWSLFYLFLIPQRLRQISFLGFKAYSIIFIYIFILYLTDNVDIYLGSQMLFFSIPFCITYVNVSKSNVDSASSPSVR